MLARTRLKLKNAESSISFMQQQHARTLEDLHKEIERLQKKNASMFPPKDIIKELASNCVFFLTCRIVISVDNDRC